MEKVNGKPEIPVPAIPPQPDIQSAPPPPKVDDAATTSALTLEWSFGMSRTVPVVNLSDREKGTKRVLYACAQNAIIFDFDKNEQTLLLTHKNNIASLASSENKRWVATACKGPDSILAIWDSYNGFPIKTIFEPHPLGCLCIALTPDAKHVVTLSQPDENERQVFAVWDWISEEDLPIATVALDPAYGIQKTISINSRDCSQIVTNGDSQVIFYQWEGSQIKFYAPTLTDDTFNKPLGKFVSSVHNRGQEVFTATSLGLIVVWDLNFQRNKAEPVSTADKRPAKLVKIQEKAITFLAFSSGFLVTGDAVGFIKFFDESLELRYWYQDLQLTAVLSVSFEYWPLFLDNVKPNNKYPEEATVTGEKFICPSFVALGTNAVLIQVEPDGNQLKLIRRDHGAPVRAIATHPTKPWLAIGGYTGYLQIWDYDAKVTVCSRQFGNTNMIQCCSFDTLGDYIGVGFVNGLVHVLDGIDLREIAGGRFDYARDAITHIAFSHDSTLMATADKDFTISLFYRLENKWFYVGRHKSHYKLIQELVFGVESDSMKPRLLSLGCDRMLVEYDLLNSSKDDLQILQSSRIEQSGIPTCMAWYPALTNESFIVTANDQFKFKLYNATTKMCRKTLLGPTFGSPLQKIAIVPALDHHTEGDKRYLAYITENQVGLHMLPLDGNCFNSLCTMAHPAGVSDMCVSNDGRFVFTSGGQDETVHAFRVHTVALQANSAMGGEGIVPFYHLIEGGKEGQFFKDFYDFFYYALIREQGVDTMKTRYVEKTIHVKEIANFMRAVGFYPSEQEIEDMSNEVKFKEYFETGQYVERIDLEELLRLYINHRPAFGFNLNELEQTFQTLGGGALTRSRFLDILQSQGEHIVESDLAEYLMILLGQTAEGASSELHDLDVGDVTDSLEENVPECIDVDVMKKLLGFQEHKEGVGEEEIDVNA